MDCLIPRVLLQKDSSYKFQFCIELYASPSVASRVKGMTGHNIKYLMSQIPIKMLKQRAIPNSSSGLKDIFITEKLVKDECMKHINSQIKKFQHKISLQNKFFASTQECFYC